MSTYEISKSSLLSLKAEILRKQQELGKTRAENEEKIRNLKKSAPLDLKNKGLEQRLINDITEEEENLLKKSRDILEAKSRLYDKLSKGSANQTEEEQERNRRYLVRFDKKSRVPDLPPEDSEDDVDRYPSDEDNNASTSYDVPSHPDEEWVEYVDCLGRTRTCLRKDLQHIKSRDKDLESTVEARRRNRSKTKSPEPSPEPEPISDNESELTEDNELLSGDMRREMLRRQWEREEEELRNKSKVHYQDILFNEARTHGVGYYGFSKDEEERAKQQDALKKLRQETRAQQKKSQNLKSMREKQLAARVKAAKARKRARLGLPPEEDEPEPEPEKAPQEEKNVGKLDENEKRLEEARKKHIRPWDFGKEGVKEHYEHTQEEWVAKQRRERPSEFAPPSAYQKDRGYRSLTAREDVEESKRSLKFTTKKSDKETITRRERINPYLNSEPPMEPVPIVDEVDSDYQDSLMADYHEISEERGRGTEIAPPPTFDYYGPNDSKRPKKRPAGGNVGDSIEAGLKFLRNQLEKKESRRAPSEDMFLS